MNIMFPVEWRCGEKPHDGIGGPAVEDAGTLYIVRDEDSDEDYPDGDYSLPTLVAKTTLTELIKYSLEGWESHEDGYTHEDHVPASDALAAALRSAANMLDAAKKPRLL